MKTPIVWVLVVACAFSSAWIATKAHARQVPLLEVSQGQLPNDTASDGLTKLVIVEYPALGGRALKVVYYAGDSFGDRQARVSNWKEFITLEFDAFNPAEEDVRVTFTVTHRRTTSYQTRVDVPITLKPGKNSVRTGIDEMVNVNGSTPDLGNVRRWYFACELGKTPTLYFGDVFLIGDDAPGPTSSTGGPAAGPPAAYKITGQIGGMPVELTATPVGGAAAVGITSPGGPAPAPIQTDPARLARIRAAKMPEITRPVMFDTPEADAICSALEVFPPDNPWNHVVENWPLHPNSDAIITSIGRQKPFRYNPDMGYILVPPDQKRVEVKLGDYPAESDPGPYPVPDNVPIEGWPVQYQRSSETPPTLSEVQRRPAQYEGDRHAIVLDPVERKLYEFFIMGRTDAGWVAAQASVFDLKTNALRPSGWTSADAAGLPIFPAVVRYDELKRGIVEHAMRVTVTKTRREFVAPATHYASSHDNPEYPRMGERLRLKAEFDVSPYSPEVQAILKGLKKYGMFVADNGIDWAISVAPDPRIPELHAELRRIQGAAFEVVVPPP
ncbi:MAG: hypothetical protein JXB62_11065 [Pirellulales bacterium]|nr:hypothetical protein [Pirellulales bacterium]